jgi:cysteine-rich repeat protein
MMVGFGNATSCCSLTGRLLGADGVPLTPEFVVDDTSDDNATTYGTVAADRDGAFLFAWQRAEPPYGTIYARRYTRDGTPDGPITLVSESTEDFPIENPGLDVPSVAADSHGDFVVVWSNSYGKLAYGPNPGPRDGPGIWGRMISVCGNGRIGRTQTCDDGNATTGDGCSGRCDIETCFGCTGEPSVCAPISGCHTTCVDGAAMADTAILTLQGTKAPAGQQSLKLRAAIPNPPFAPLEYDPSVRGMEIAVTAANALVWEAAIPAGPLGSGCAPRDGWKRSGTGAWQYVNKSGALPPACTPGSARGLRSVKMRDRLATGSGIAVDAKVAKTTFGVANPIPPALATVVLGRGPDAGLAGKCGRILLRTAIGTRFYP